MLNLRFNNNLYNKRAVKAAVSAYAHLAKFIIKNTKNYTQVEINDIDQRFKKVFVDEFANYVLWSNKEWL